MTMKLFLIQHGKAHPESIDPERHLTEEGKKETKLVASFLAKSKLVSIKCIYHSGKARSRETAEIFSQYLKPHGGVVQDKHLNPLDDPTMWLQKLERETENLMLVGHLPHLSRLASLLITRRPDDEIIKFRYSGAVCLEKLNNEDLWIILWYVTPELLE